MRSKKNPKADLNKKSTFYFSIGLFIVLFVSWQAIEYKNYDVINFSMIEVLEEENNDMATNFSLLYNSLIELTNPLSSKEALKKVKELRTKYPSLFTSTKMFLAAYEILSSYRFQLHVRRYIHDIFKIGLGNFSSIEEIDDEEKKM